MPSSPFSSDLSRPPAPSGLLCDLLAMPGKTRIATLRPTFGWIPGGGKPGPAQQAYQVRVALGPAGNGTALWDTGTVVSSSSLNIEYAGEPLAWGGAWCWTVRTWATGSDLSEQAASPWAAPQYFTLADRAPSGPVPKGGGDNEPVSVYQPEVHPVASVRLERDLAGGRGWTIDFGKQAFGWLELDLEAPSNPGGSPVTVRLGEAWRDGALDRTPPGSVRYAESVVTLRAGRHRYRVETPADERNTTWPAAIRLPAALGVVLPFRFAEVEADSSGVVLHEAFLMRVQYPFDEHAAAFRSSSPELDAVWELCRYSMLATSFAGYYVDGDRERIPYEADAFINQLSHYAVDREFSLARRTHEYLLAHPTWPTEWKQHSILIAWADYEATGDARSLRRHYGCLKNEKLLSQYERADGLLVTGNLRELQGGRTDCGDIVDWPLCERDGYDFRLVNTVVNAFHYRTLVLMEKIARAVGNDRDAEAFASRAAAFYDRFNEVLFDAGRDGGVYIDGEGSDHASLHANLFPLAFGLVPAERRAGVVAFIRSRGMACSVYPAQFLLEGLFESGVPGAAEYAIGLMAGGGLRSWRNMLDHDATITWEAWDQSFKPNQDWNHAWGAAPANIITRYVLGVRPLEPGYGRILVAPQLGTLTKAEGTVPTIRGPVRVRAWRDAGGSTHCEVEAPANVTVSALA
ncbi:alpha-L-rhamnosidase [Opitutaceae bacterium TAV1]|nr:alpha-L-rhamnosidase [Opitutaceae bacterium TAV1]